MIETTRDRAIDSRAAAVPMPVNLADAERARRGSGNYDEMCVHCHLKPGTTESEIRKGLYPVPPDLTKADAARNANAELNAKRQFWVIKHGIKASGMAAWAKGGMEDEAIWDLVAFLQKMPSMSADEYQTLVKSSGGHSHAGADHHDNSDGHHDAPKKEPTKKPHDDHGHGDHTH
jgi:cytochrome c